MCSTRHGCVCLCVCAVVHSVASMENVSMVFQMNRFIRSMFRLNVRVLYNPIPMNLKWIDAHAHIETPSLSVCVCVCVILNVINAI